MRAVNFGRLLAALVVLGATLLPMYWFWLRSDARIEAGFSKAVLLDTPPAGGQQKVGLRPGELAPDFEISTVEGQRIRLSDLRGKPVVISFFALWCGSCLSEMPDIDAVHERRGRSSFTVLAINTGETRERAVEFIDFIKAPFTWALDFDLTVADAYGVRGLPQTYYLDRNGIVRASFAGTADEPRLNAYLDAAFKAAEPPQFPVTIRPPLSTIPRERVLTVEVGEGGTIVFASRTLRCDPAYCAQASVDALRQLAGIRSVSFEPASNPEPGVFVRFDPAKTSVEQVVQHFASLLRAVEDPVYGAELEIRASTVP